MHEGGAPKGGGDNQPYTVPAESKTMYLPGGLFLNDWIHVLEDSELAFVLMLACLRSRADKAPVFATSEVRLLQFGLGRDAYESHRILSRFGLVRVHGGHQGRRLGKPAIPQVRAAQAAQVRVAQRRVRRTRPSSHAPRAQRSVSM